MSNPWVHAFFVGKAVADLLYEQLENSLTDALSELGKFDAEQRERLRNFTSAAIARANQLEETAPTASYSSSPFASQPTDLQATIDELRAEIAQLRAQLQRYRSRSV
jgi:phage shock protein A